MLDMKIFDRDYFSQYYQLANSATYADASFSSKQPRCIDQVDVDATVDSESYSDTLSILIREISEQGACIVAFNPTTKYETILAWQQRIFGRELPGSTGKTFSKISAEKDGKYFANSNVGQPMHSDDAHLTRTPRLISLYCQTQSARGGVTTLVPIYLWLRAQAVAGCIPHSCFADDALTLEGAGGLLMRPLLVCDREQLLCAFPSILRRASGKAEVMDFYDRIMQWAHEPSNQIRFKLREGELLVLDNYKWLHGRTGFKLPERRILYRASFDGQILTRQTAH